MVITSESDGATLDFKRCSSGDLGMPLSAQKVPLDRNVRNGNALNTDAKCCLKQSDAGIRA